MIETCNSHHLVNYARSDCFYMLTVSYSQFIFRIVSLADNSTLNRIMVYHQNGNNLQLLDHTPILNELPILNLKINVDKFISCLNDLNHKYKQLHYFI